MVLVYTMVYKFERIIRTLLADQQERFVSESPDKFILGNFEPKKVLGVSWDTLSDEFVFSLKKL